MFKPTHQAMTYPVSIGGSIALNATLSAAAVIVLTARAGAMIPDKMEKIFGVPQAKHRTWTHWLVTCILAGLSIGLLVYGIGYGTEMIARDRLTGPHAHEVIRVIHQSSIAFGYFIGMGAMIGAVMHSLADACTEGGVPLLGPFYNKKIYLMPAGFRCGVGKKVKDENGKMVKTFELTAGEKRWFVFSYVMTALILFFHFAPVLHLQQHISS